MDSLSDRSFAQWIKRSIDSWIDRLLGVFLDSATDRSPLWSCDGLCVPLMDHRASSLIRQAAFVFVGAPCQSTLLYTIRSVPYPAPPYPSPTLPDPTTVLSPILHHRALLQLYPTLPNHTLSNSSLF